MTKSTSARSETPSHFFTEDESRRIVEAIRKAESGTTGEIRVRLERRTKGAVLDAARAVFHRLRMDRTAARNGVLIYLSLQDHAFAIYGDAGVDRILGASGWNGIRDRMAARFRKGDFAGGVVDAIGEVGTELARHFPAAPGDRNELSDDLSHGE
jgi:uncharacterized membrane protein